MLFYVDLGVNIKEFQWGSGWFCYALVERVGRERKRERERTKRETEIEKEIFLYTYTHRAQHGAPPGPWGPPWTTRGPSPNFFVLNPEIVRRIWEGVWEVPSAALVQVLGTFWPNCTEAKKFKLSSKWAPNGSQMGPKWADPGRMGPGRSQ